MFEPESQLLLDNIGSSACELLGFRKVAFVRMQPDTEIPTDSTAAGNYVRIQEPGSSSEVTFSSGPCPSKKVLYVGCNHLGNLHCFTHFMLRWTQKTNLNCMFMSRMRPETITHKEREGPSWSRGLALACCPSEGWNTFM